MGTGHGGKPAVVLAGTASAVGKTSLAIGLMAALRYILCLERVLSSSRRLVRFE